MWSLTKCQLNFVHISFSGKTSVSKRDIPVVSILCLSQVIYQMRKTMKLSISVLKLSVMVFTSKRLYIHPCNAGCSKMQKVKISRWRSPKIGYYTKLSHCKRNWDFSCKIVAARNFFVLMGISMGKYLDRTQYLF